MMARTNRHDLMQLLSLSTQKKALENRLRTARHEQQKLEKALDTTTNDIDDTITLPDLIRQRNALEDNLHHLNKKLEEEIHIIETLRHQRDQLYDLKIIIEDFKKRKQAFAKLQESASQTSVNKAGDSRQSLFEQYLERLNEVSQLRKQLIWNRVLKRYIVEKIVSSETLWQQKLHALNVNIPVSKIKNLTIKDYEADVLQKVKRLLRELDSQ